jgi:hypothetical protein
VRDNECFRCGGTGVVTVRGKGTTHWDISYARPCTCEAGERTGDFGFAVIVNKGPITTEQGR